MRHRSWSYLIVLVLLLCPILLVACDKDKDNNPTGKVPEYQGMVVSNSRTNSAMISNNGNNGNGNNGNGNNGNHLNPGQHNGHTPNNKPNIDKDEPFGDNNQVDNKVSSLIVEGASENRYYSTINEDVFITIKLSNPDQYEILSFTLNDKKYSSYMFEDGSDMENLILKVNVGDIAGLKNYTIDAIKYVDGDSIKDVIMKGEKTISVGVRKDNMVVAQVSNETVGLDSISFDVSLSDDYGLIALSGGKTVAVLYDGNAIVAEKNVTIGNSHIVFDNLNCDAVYQYAIVSGFDDFSGNASSNHILYKNAACTERMVEFTNVELGYNNVSWEYLWNESVLDNDKEIVSQELYVNNTKLKDVDSTSINQLYAGTSYTIKTTYKNTNGENQYAYLNFTTNNVMVPTYSLVVHEISATSVVFRLNISDPYNLGSFDFCVTDVNNEIVFSSTTLTYQSQYITVDNLEQNTKYFGVVNYTYDSCSAAGVVNRSVSVDAYTKLANPPTVVIENVVNTSEVVTFEVNVVDELNIVEDLIVSIRSTNGLVRTLVSDDNVYELTALAVGEYTLRAQITYVEGGLIKYQMATWDLKVFAPVTISKFERNSGEDCYFLDQLNVELVLESYSAPLLDLTHVVINNKYFVAAGTPSVMGFTDELRARIVSYNVAFTPAYESGETTFTITGLVYGNSVQEIEEIKQKSFTANILGMPKIKKIYRENNVYYIKPGDDAIILDIESPQEITITSGSIRITGNGVYDQILGFSSGNILEQTTNHIKISGFYTEAYDFPYGAYDVYVENINFNYCGRSYYCTFGVSSQIDEWATTQLIVVENYSVVNIYNATGLMNAEFGNDDYRVYSLCDDIDMQGRQWRPKSLKGIFFGNGHKISNIELTSENMSSSMSNIGGAHSTGLFWLAKDSIIDSLIVENITINIQQMLIGVKVYAAGLLAQTAGLVVVNNCIVTGEIKVVGDVDLDVAGIVARAEDGRCFVFNSENKANIIVSTKGVAFVGGIVSRVFSEIFEANSCKNSGEIQVIDIFKQSNEEEIPVHAKFYVGGIVGSFGNLTYIYKQEHSLINCTNTEQISLTNIKIYQGCLFVGGVLGYRDVNLDTLQEVSIKDCENSGEIVEDVNNQYLEDTLVSINNIIGYNNNDSI